MSRGKLGVWFIGALGSISATVIVGALAIRRNVATETGLVTSGKTGRS